MYILLIFVHSLFIFITHLFQYYVIEGVFIVLLLFFLLYFSPIFFFKNSQKSENQGLFVLEFSPQKSLIIPLILTYIGIYILAFTFSGNIHQAIHLHMIIFLAIYGVFLGYTFAFDWKNKVFFDVIGFHLLFSYITLCIVGLYYFFFPENINIVDVIFVIMVGIFSVLFFSLEQKGRENLFYGFLLSIFLIGEILLFFVFPNISFAFIIGILMILAIGFFEYSKKGEFFEYFRYESRVFFLGFALFCSFLLLGRIFFEFESIYFLIIATIFFFSVHIRFSNVITYGVGIFIMYFLYTFLFFSLIQSSSIFSTLLFIYFFPLVLIGNTFFWQEKQKYDFSILHYSSIGFSIAFFMYSIIIIDWGNSSFIFISFGLLLLAILFFLSYFRFYK